MLTIMPNPRNPVLMQADPMSPDCVTIADVRAQHLLITGFNLHGSLDVSNVECEELQLASMEVRRSGREGGVWIENVRARILSIGPEVDTDYLRIQTTQVDEMRVTSITDIALFEVARTTVRDLFRLEHANICRLSIHSLSKMGVAEVTDSLVGRLSVRLSITPGSVDSWLGPEVVMPDDMSLHHCDLISTF